MRGRVAALARSQMNDLLSLEKAIKQTGNDAPSAKNNSNWCTGGPEELQAYNKLRILSFSLISRGEYKNGTF